MLKFNVEMFNINVCINLTKVSSFFQKYSLNITLHILTQCVNNLIIKIII